MDSYLLSENRKLGLWILCFVIIVTIPFTVNHNFTHVHTSSFTSAVGILSFLMYIVLLLLPKLLSDLVMEDFSIFSFLATTLNGVLFVAYAIILIPAWMYLPDWKETWQLCAPCIFVSVLSSLWLAMKGHAPIEISIDLRNVPTIGEVWANACFSYYKKVLEDFRERLARFEKKQRTDDETFSIRLKKMVVLIPLSCNIDGTLDRYPNIEYVDELEILRDDQGGNVNRQYKNPVYKVTSTVGDHSSHLYIALEQPNTLKAVKKLKDSVTEEIWKFQRYEFISALYRQLDETGCTAVLLYDDLQGEHTVPLNEFLTKEVTELLKREENNGYV